MAVENCRVLFKDYVDAGPVTADSFMVMKSMSVPSMQEKAGLQVCGDNEVIALLLYCSCDPYMRGRMRNEPGYFVGPLTPGEPVTSAGIAKVLKSEHPGFKEGEFIRAFMPWEDYVVLDAQALKGATKIENPAKLPLSYYLGTLGMTGMTAYASLIKIGKPKAGETVFVTAAAGAVGTIVGQLCKNVYGCHVVGSAGSDDKVKYLLELGFDAAFNYKTTTTDQGLKQHCPKGVDVYFENVGGETLETVLNHCNTHARIVACGMISQYDKGQGERYGVSNLFLIVTKRILMQGFIVGDYIAEMGAPFAKDMAEYVTSGKVKPVEHLVQGLENAGQAFVDMMSGKNVGKMVVQVAQDPFRPTGL